MSKYILLPMYNGGGGESFPYAKFEWSKNSDGYTQVFFHYFTDIPLTDADLGSQKITIYKNGEVFNTSYLRSASSYYVYMDYVLPIYEYGEFEIKFQIKNKTYSSIKMVEESIATEYYQFTMPSNNNRLRLTFRKSTSGYLIKNNTERIDFYDKTQLDLNSINNATLYAYTQPHLYNTNTSISYGFEQINSLQPLPTDGGNMFFNNTYLKTYNTTLTKGVTNGQNMFRNCTNLESMVIYDTLTNLQYMFYNCSNLKNLEMFGDFSKITKIYFSNWLNGAGGTAVNNGYTPTIYCSPTTKTYLENNSLIPNWFTVNANESYSTY